jgi:hypothetical protein
MKRIIKAFAAFVAVHIFTAYFMLASGFDFAARNTDVGMAAFFTAVLGLCAAFVAYQLSDES